jgi:hypothetical protein
MHSPDDQMKTPRHCLFPKSNIRQQSYGPACRLFSRPRHRLCWRSLDRLQILRLGARSASRRIRRTRVRAMNDTRFSSSDERWPLMAALTWIATRSLKFVEQLAFCDPAEAEPFLFEARKISGAPCQISYSDSFYSIETKRLNPAPSSDQDTRSNGRLHWHMSYCRSRNVSRWPQCLMNARPAPSAPENSRT